MMKKSIVLLLILSMLLSVFMFGCSQDEEPVDTPPVDDQEPVDEPEGPVKPTSPQGQLTIGNTTE